MKDKLGALSQFPMFILVSLWLKGSDDPMTLTWNKMSAFTPQKHIFLHQVHVVWFNFYFSLCLVSLIWFPNVNQHIQDFFYSESLKGSSSYCYPNTWMQQLIFQTAIMLHHASSLHSLIPVDSERFRGPDKLYILSFLPRTLIQTQDSVLETSFPLSWSD